VAEVAGPFGGGRRLQTRLALAQVEHRAARSWFGLFKIFVHSFVCVQESIIPSLPPPIRTTHTTAIVLRDFCAMYEPPRPSFYVPYTIQYW